MAHRRLFHALLFERDGDLNLSQLLLCVLVAVGAFAFIYEVLTGNRASIASWSFLGATVSALLIGALPLAKAKILANSRLPGEVAKGIASSENVERSTDLMEIAHSKPPDHEMG